MSSLQFFKFQSLFLLSLEAICNSLLSTGFIYIAFSVFSAYFVLQQGSAYFTLLLVEGLVWRP